MKFTLRDKSKAQARRRGVTLVEMLVTLAVLLLMMTAIVRIFQAATGSLNSAQVFQQLDNQLRQLDVTLRSDLSGVTAKMTPPNDPKDNTGYFEYGENEFADNQGEDADDYVRFTAKAPAGRPFTGRVYVPTTGFSQNFFNNASQPITITSDYAEIIYFLRNGNLYRRVFLIAPERQSTLAPAFGNQGYVRINNGNIRAVNFLPVSLNGNQVSWQGVHDLSAHPATTGTTAFNTGNSVILNTLGDLTNRENRAFYQRFSSDYQELDGDLAPDGLDDDFNTDNVPDYYPTLYPAVFAAANPLIFEPPFPVITPAFRGLTSFPFVFPGAYSKPQILDVGGNSVAPFGWIHSPNPLAFDPVNNANVAFNTDPLTYLNLINHNPIDLGDNLALPGSADLNRGTWWGFPTWRETLSPSWVDPTLQVNLLQAQPIGLRPRYADAIPGVPTDQNLLPAMQRPANLTSDAFAIFRSNPDNFTDGYGSSSAFWGGGTRTQAPLWASSWEDDLIMTGVRSFDVKAYDNSRSDYVDLGWGDDERITNSGLVPPAYLAATPLITTWNLKFYNTLSQTLAHEGRMPPLVNDHRLDATYPNPTYNGLNGTFIAQYSGFPNYSSNVGDDNAAIVRLRRVWDSWSTDYSRAPATGVLANGFPWGPPFAPPIYPSYPPPYPAPLRGIQIQIRVVDPSNQRIKSLTIRQDFTDKL